MSDAAVYAAISALVTDTLGHNENTVLAAVCGGVEAGPLADYIASRSSAATKRMTGRDEVWAPDVEEWMPALVEAARALIDRANELKLKTAECPKKDMLYGCTGLASEEPHLCPYKSDLNGDYETLCRCCANCAGGCAADL